MATVYKEVFTKYFVKLSKNLPMDDEFFIKQLSEEHLMPGNVQSNIDSLPIQAEKSVYFLSHVIQPSLGFGIANSFDTLLGIMERYEEAHVQNLAAAIKHDIINGCGATASLKDQEHSGATPDSFDCAAATERIIANYVELTNLPINSILPELLAKKVVSPRQEKIIKTISTQSNRMQYLIDKVIVTGLNNDISSKFKGLLEVMEKADDGKFVSIAHKLAMADKEHPPTVDSSAFDCTTARRRIMSHYTEIIVLPINLILRQLLAKKVITFKQKELIEAKPGQNDKMMYFIDDVIMPNLEFNISLQFKGFLEVMEKSGDEVLISIAQKLGGSRVIP